MAQKPLAMMPWYPRDFMASTRGWPLIPAAIYRELLDAQWDIGSLPVSIAELRELSRASPSEWKAGWPRVEAKFPIDGNCRKNLRLEEHRRKSEHLAEMRREIGSRGGKASAQAKAQAIGTPLVNHPSPSPSPYVNHPDSEALKRASKGRDRTGPKAISEIMAKLGVVQSDPTDEIPF